MASSNFDKERLELSENEVVVDRISNLPDHVLCLILSFLETQQSVQTCILSKRWRFLWINVNKLEFRCPILDPLPNSLKRFGEMVMMAMLLHNSRSLDHFTLTWRRYCDPFIVATSLSTAIYRNVKILHLFISCLDGKCVAIPCSLFTCKSLYSISLNGDFLVEIPTVVSLPRLLFLFLSSVKYKCAKALEKIIKGSPVLDCLHVYRTRFDNVGVFRISSPKLTDLVVNALDKKKTFPEHIVPKLEINAPALEVLRIEDSVSKDFTFQSLSSSVQVFRIASLHLFFFYSSYVCNSCNYFLNSCHVLPTECFFLFFFFVCYFCRKFQEQLSIPVKTLKV